MTVVLYITVKKFVVHLVQPFTSGAYRKHLSLLDPPVLLYVLKCLIGLAAGYTLYRTFPQHQFYWSLISIVIVLAPDNTDSTKLAAERIAANIVGSTIGVTIFILHIPNLWLMGIGVIVTILICAQLSLLNAVRSALAALLVVMMHENQGGHWRVGLERLGCVMVGCLIALLITALFERLKKKR